MLLYIPAMCFTLKTSLPRARSISVICTSSFESVEFGQLARAMLPLPGLPISHPSSNIPLFYGRRSRLFILAASY